MFSRLLIYFLKKSGLTAVIKKAIAEPPLSPVEIELIATRAILRERSQQLSKKRSCGYDVEILDTRYTIFPRFDKEPIQPFLIGAPCLDYPSVIIIPQQSFQLFVSWRNGIVRGVSLPHLRIGFWKQIGVFCYMCFKWTISCEQTQQKVLCLYWLPNFWSRLAEVSLVVFQSERSDVVALSWIIFETKACVPKLHFFFLARSAQT